MKKVFFFFFLLSSILLSAKKVKFAVDMSGQIINPLGIRVTGDFQTAAGYTGGNWTSATLMNQEVTDTNIYSIVVDIPAFAKYEYKFMNGDQFYEAEFVPLESRVGYNFNDNRWIYVDSLANDTTFVGAIRFGGNAPRDKKLIRFYVDMVNEIISSSGVHVAGDFQNWSPVNTILYNFDSSSVYEIICYVDSLSSYEYRYYNGNAIADSENVPSVCAVNYNRQFTSVNDSMMPIICFSSCGACVTTAIPSKIISSDFELFPNPTTTLATIQLTHFNENTKLIVTDFYGRLLRDISVQSSDAIPLSRDGLSPGVYFVSLQVEGKTTSVKKWIIE